MHRRSPHFTLAALTVAVLATAGAACGDDEVASNAERFCGEAAAQRDLILAPPMGTPEELAATLDFYRLMGDLAPVAVADDWNTVVAAMEAATELIPGNPDSEQFVAMTAYAAEPSAYRVSVWLRDNCAVDLPVTTIAPQERAPAPTPPTSPSESTPSESTPSESTATG